jgi:transposase
MRARYLQLTSSKAQLLSALKNEAEKDGAFRVAKRIHAVLLNHQKHSSGEIATILAAPRSKVSLWLGQYEEYGWEGLLEGHRSGRPRQLDVQQRQGLCAILDSGPVAYGFLSGVWTSPMIARVIQEEYQVDYHPGHVRKLLQELGFSVQRPRKLLAKGDPVEQDRWQRYTYPRLKKNR